MTKTLIGALLVALSMLVAVAPANAVQPKPGSWFTNAVDPKDEDNLSSIQFKVANNRKKLVKVTIFWQCGDQSGYYTFKNPPIPTAITKERFKLVGASASPDERTTKDFTFKGKFTSPKKANYSMKLQGCGPATTGKLSFADS
jgi:outer membrane protein W